MKRWYITSLEMRKIINNYYSVSHEKIEELIKQNFRIKLEGLVFPNDVTFIHSDYCIKFDGYEQYKDEEGKGTFIMLTEINAIEFVKRCFPKYAWSIVKILIDSFESEYIDQIEKLQKN